MYPNLPHGRRSLPAAARGRPRARQPRELMHSKLPAAEHACTHIEADLNLS